MNIMNHRQRTDDLVQSDFKEDMKKRECSSTRLPSAVQRFKDSCSLTAQNLSQMAGNEGGEWKRKNIS